MVNYMEKLIKEIIEFCGDKNISFNLEAIEVGETHIDYNEANPESFTLYYNINDEDGLEPKIKEFLNNNKI